MRTRHFIFSAILLTTAILLAGCTGNADTAHRANDEVIVVMNTESEPEAGFDPAYGWGAGEHMHEPLIQSTLLVTKTDLTIGYDLATDVSTSDDGFTWTVTIRDDVAFTDGIPLTAHDVAFTYNTVKASSSVTDLTMLESATALDDTTVEFHLTRPFSVWPYTMTTVGIVPEYAYDAQYGQNPIGSGRYMLAQWDKGQQVILEANPHYYGEAPLMRKVTILFMEEDAALAAAKAGQVDLAYTAATYANQTVDGYQLFAAASVDNRGFSLPAIPHDGTIGNDVTSDLAIRRAINIGLDRERLVNEVLNGHGSPAYSVCDGLPWFNREAIVEYDADAAIRILEEAGWVLGDDGVRTKGSLTATIPLIYPASDSVRQALVQAASNQLAALGIATVIEGVGWDVAYDRAQTEVMTWGWGAHTPMELYNIYRTDPEIGLARYSPYANATVDRYMDEALAESDTEASYELWQKAQGDHTTGTIGDAPWVWLVNIDHLYWVHDDLNVAEQKIHPHGHGWSIVNNIDRWSWK
ncbi:MAG: ABC transporter substrate-binding protein [Coriobacteriia bacterium]|nr:ABC transporter substrate-binding protein [Coriobacteriia bacterium]